MSGHTTITYGERTKPLRACIAHHLKFSKDFAESSMENWHIANVHWAPALVSKNKAEKRRFSDPISRNEAKRYDCTMWRKR